MLKYLYLVGAIFFTVVIMIVAFGNIQAICVDMVVFFTEIEPSTPPTILIFWVAIIGIITGFLYHGFISSFFSKSDENEDEDY